MISLNLRPGLPAKFRRELEQVSPMLADLLVKSWLVISSCSSSLRRQAGVGVEAALNGRKGLAFRQQGLAPSAWITPNFSNGGRPIHGTRRFSPLCSTAERTVETKPKTKPKIPAIGRTRPAAIEPAAKPVIVAKAAKGEKKRVVVGKKPTTAKEPSAKSENGTTAAKINERTIANLKRLPPREPSGEFEDERSYGLKSRNAHAGRNLNAKINGAGGVTQDTSTVSPILLDSPSSPSIQLSTAEVVIEEDTVTVGELQEFVLEPPEPTEEPKKPVDPLKPSVHVVSDRDMARKVARVLMDNAEPYYAVDTEVADIDLNKVGPIGHGYVTCVSIYGGPDLDYGEGKGKVIWVDNLDAAEGVLEEFREFLESPKHKKVWHNYAFDRHVLFNKSKSGGAGGNIDCKGFAGDTQHMARLWDTALDKKTGQGVGFSLEALSKQLLGDQRSKTAMKDLFGVAKKRKDGTDGSLLTLPPIDELQRSHKYRADWIDYSARDALVTWELREVLEAKLKAMPWESANGDMLSMWEFYEAYYVPFGELLTDMERAGIYVNAAGYLAQVQVQALEDQKAALQTFLDWVKKNRPEAAELNPSSTLQIAQLLFGGAKKNQQYILEPSRTFQIERTPEELAEIEKDKDEFSDLTAVELKALCKERGYKVSGKKDDLLSRLRGLEPIDPEDEFKKQKVGDLRSIALSKGMEGTGTKADLVKRLSDEARYQIELRAGNTTDAETEKNKKNTQIAVPSVKITKNKDLVVRGCGLQPMKFTKGGAPQVSMDVLRELAGQPRDNPPKYGRAREHFGGGKAGLDACLAIDALCRMGSIDTMLSTFLLPLQELVDERSRVHCSLNINTETGRLSSRRPNLQNQPALEKDQYKIRAAFSAEEGKRLIVADYGQLELRLLAHITECKSMLDAFRQGGCFHSRTAVGMFDHVRKAVDDGEVYLEWDRRKGEPDKPLVKDKYAAERRKAKTLNFSIAYGKTPHGLSKDWGVTVKEAEALLTAWYKDRPEVKKWQEDTIKLAEKTGYSKTLMGRLRHLPDITSKDRKLKSHSQRAAINTPVQGGAADIAAAAMIKIVRSEKLKRLGWTLLLQVHDEVILEGPEESVEEAQAEVVHCMEEPWDNFGLKPLSVHLAVDANNAKTWYEAK